MDLTRPIAGHRRRRDRPAGPSVNTMLAAIDTARRAQRTLVEDAGHELRTPLTSIRTNIELLLEVERPARAGPPPAARGARQAAAGPRRPGRRAGHAHHRTGRAGPGGDHPGDGRGGRADRRGRRRDQPGPDPRPGLTFTTDLRPVTVHGRPGRAGTHGRQRARQRRQVEPARRDRAHRLRADGPAVPADRRRHRPRHRRGRPPARLRPLLPGPAARAMPGSGLGLAIVAQTATQHGGTVTAGCGIWPRGRASAARSSPSPPPRNRRATARRGARHRGPARAR
jgi:two-component system sensor histidine kinase MprB